MGKRYHHPQTCFCWRLELGCHQNCWDDMMIFVQISFVLLGYYQNFTPSKTNMRIENQPFEDVSPIKGWGFSSLSGGPGESQVGCQE